ncbi:SAM-dependent methyltransferase [Amycolatopsis sp. H20-H5]|uniref:SAM-dependent methyltransferase n=1 Tax=Amycolatopsis sp. H20-H5 TaxID=3046309 RepID=UPI002DBB7380|nr:SAM-dependent methyltransferase [Amycolatopsis sp. H20-H5]MEC3980154.1 SAM-dependent methyltransferase [Amycolatopsis sp. H20-H5]
MEQAGPGVTEGVGLTALMVASARAIETHHRDSLVADPYAEHFVRAAQVSTPLPTRIEDVPGGDADPVWGRGGRYYGLRTRVFDEFLLRSAHAGARQIVLFGAGLDTRAFRLDWPVGTVVFELDLPSVLAFKQSVLAGLDAVAKVANHRLGVDLREGWVSELTAAGFDPALPTAWLAEGLLTYLPAAVEERLLASVDSLSAAGSALSFEILLDQDTAEIREDTIYENTEDELGVNLPSLFDPDPRPDSVAAVAARGWSVTSHTAFEFTRQYGRGPEPEVRDALANSRWIFATKPQTDRLGCL